MWQGHRSLEWIPHFVLKTTGTTHIDTYTHTHTHAHTRTHARTHARTHTHTHTHTYTHCEVSSLPYYTADMVPTRGFSMMISKINIRACFWGYFCACTIQYHYIQLVSCSYAINKFSSSTRDYNSTQQKINGRMTNLHSRNGLCI